MPSPFPGMDPYLEDPAFWPDFHGRFIYAVSDYLLERLPATYDANVDERVRLVEAAPDASALPRAQDVRPDVAVSRYAGGGRAGRSDLAGGVAVLPEVDLEPVVITVPALEEVVERWIEIRHRPDNVLVTAIEVLSPTNKAGDGLADYRAKRQAVFRRDASLVEIDLLLGGQRVERSAGMPAGDYYTIVSRAPRPTHRAVYAWSVRRALPTIPVPLKLPDPDVPLDLAAAFAAAYDRGRYHRRLRYNSSPPAPLQEADRPWAADLACQPPATPGGAP